MPNLLEHHQTTQDYVNVCRVEAWKDDLIDAVKGGQVSFAYAAIKKLRRLEVKSLLDIGDRGTGPHQLRGEFWAAITGDDRPDDSIEAEAELEPKPTDENGPSIFAGEEGEFFRDSTTSRGITPLHWAAFAGQCALLRKLIRLGADPARLYAEGGTVLHAAALGGSLETVTFLTETARLDPLRSDRNGDPPIIWAIQERHPEVTDYFQCKGQSLSFKDKYGFNALTEAARADDAELVRKLIEEWGYLPDCKTKDGQTPLHVACRGDRAESAEAVAMLATVFKVDLFARTSEEGWTPVHIAASAGKVSAIDVLVREAIQRGQLYELVNATDHHGRTPLHMAAMFRRSIAVERLLAADVGANPNLTDKDGSTALEEAIVNYDRRSRRYCSTVMPERTFRGKAGPRFISPSIMAISIWSSDC